MGGTTAAVLSRPDYEDDWMFPVRLMRWAFPSWPMPPGMPDLCKAVRLAIPRVRCTLRPAFASSAAAQMSGIIMFCSCMNPTVSHTHLRCLNSKQNFAVVSDGHGMSERIDAVLRRNRRE